MAPDKFYDYWQNGFTIGGGIGYSQSPNSAVLLSANYTRFSLSKERFFSGLQIPSKGNSISGAATHIIAASALYKYEPSSQAQALPIYFLFGGNIELTSIGAATAIYSGYTADQPSEPYLVLSAVIGIGLTFKINPVSDLYIEGKYILGVLRKANANSNFIPINIGLQTAI